MILTRAYAHTHTRALIVPIHFQSIITATFIMKNHCPTSERVYFSHLLSLHITTLFGALRLPLLEFLCKKPTLKLQLNWRYSAHLTCWGQHLMVVHKNSYPTLYITYTSFYVALTTVCLNQREK